MSKLSNDFDVTKILKLIQDIQDTMLEAGIKETDVDLSFHELDRDTANEIMAWVTTADKTTTGNDYGDSMVVRSIENGYALSFHSVK